MYIDYYIKMLQIYCIHITCLALMLAESKWLCDTSWRAILSSLCTSLTNASTSCSNAYTQVHTYVSKPIKVQGVCVSVCAYSCVCVCVYSCVCVCASGNRPANWKVAGLIPAQDTLVLLFPWPRNFTDIAPMYPTVKRVPGAHTAVTLMGTWCKFGEANAQLSISR